MPKQDRISLEHAKTARIALQKKFPNASVGISGSEEQGYKISVRVSTAQEQQAIPKDCRGVSVTAHVFAGAAKKF